jgi:mRNA interferase RelE/StbE
VRHFRIDIPPHVAEVLRTPEIKRSLKAALRAIVAEPDRGEPLLRELEGLQKYRVRRFRIVYRTKRKARVIQVMAIGHRRLVYEELAERLRQVRSEW